MNLVLRQLRRQRPLPVLCLLATVVDVGTALLIPTLSTEIGRAVRKLMAGRTSFVIAHRLSTITGTDQILVMDHGDIIEQGTHASLMTAGGAYARLYESQFA